MANFTLHFDGSCGPKNPGGVGAYGIILEKEHTVNGTAYTLVPICEEAGVLGSGPSMTNNVAEFDSLGIGLIRLLDYGTHLGDTLAVFGDSNLVIQIMSGKWNPSPEKLYFPAFRRTKSFLDKLESNGVTVDFKWIPREENTECDKLSKEHNKSSK